jgi:hypothetical protein
MGEKLECLDCGDVFEKEDVVAFWHCPTCDSERCYAVGQPLVGAMGDTTEADPLQVKLTRAHTALKILKKHNRLQFEFDAYLFAVAEFGLGERESLPAEPQW